MSIDSLAITQALKGLLKKQPSQKPENASITIVMGGKSAPHDAPGMDALMSPSDDTTPMPRTEQYLAGENPDECHMQEEEALEDAENSFYREELDEDGKRKRHGY